jgi:hypothetical protein
MSPAVLALALHPLADISGTGAASDVTAAAVLTLVLPLVLLILVLAAWALAARRGWPPLTRARRRAVPSQHGSSAADEGDSPAARP